MDLSDKLSVILGASLVAIGFVTNAHGDFLHESCPANSFDMTSFVRIGAGVTSEIIWEAKSFDLRECARFCISRSSCVSFTYHTKTTVCGLSKHTLDTGKVAKGRSLIYSEYTWLPSEVTFCLKL